MNWFLDPIMKQYADFSGRATRREYWMFTMMYFVFFVALITVAIIVGVSAGEADAFMGVVFGLIIVVSLALLVPTIAITVRRLHDMGMSGWWWFIGLVPYVGGFVLIVLCCLPSQPGTNKYGANKYGVMPMAAPVAQAPAPAETQVGNQ